MDACLGHPPAVLGQHPQVVSEQVVVSEQEVDQLRIPLGLVVSGGLTKFQLLQDTIDLLRHERDI